jgi:hypothetical protein
MVKGPDVLISPALRSAVAAAVSCCFTVALPAPAPAHADCGDPGQPTCAGPIPTIDQVVAVLAGLTDPDIPAANKTNIVSPGFSPDEAATIDNHLDRMRRYPLGSLLPLHFVVKDVEPAPNNFAGATVGIAGGRRQNMGPRSVVLVDQGGEWLLTHDAAMSEMAAIWNTANRPGPGFVK